MAKKEDLEFYRAIGVKCLKVLGAEQYEVEFFPTSILPPLVDPDHFAPDTLVPSPPAEDEQRDHRGGPERHYPVPKSLAAIIAKPSVS